MNIIIRNAILTDAPSIATIHLNCWRTNYSGMFDQTFLDNLKWEDRLVNRQRIIQEDPCIQLVALYNGLIVGFCDAGNQYFRSNQDASYEQRKDRNETGEIYAIYVEPNFQHKGIGKKLFEQAKNELKSQNLIPFIVWTLKANLESCRFYETLGGKKVDEMMCRWGGEPHLQVGYKFT